MKGLFIGFQVHIKGHSDACMQTHALKSAFLLLGMQDSLGWSHTQGRIH